MFLYNRTKHHYYFSSQSWEDNNEGFDVDLAEGGDDGDEWEIRLGWLPNHGFAGCPGNANPSEENIGWAFYVWR